MVSIGVHLLALAEIVHRYLALFQGHLCCFHTKKPILMNARSSESRDALNVFGTSEYGIVQDI